MIINVDKMTVIVDIESMKFNTGKAKILVESSRLKRAAIADECGVEVTTLTHYLNGHAVPGRPVVKLLAQTLEVPETELWLDNEDKKSA